MEVCFALVVASFIIFILLLLTIALSDCDLTLKYCEKFGTPIEKLAGKVVWIIGASSGIGEGLAKTLAQVNCKLILTARREDELERVKLQCNELGAKDVVVLPFDVTAISEHETCVEKAFECFGSVDIMVCNSGRSQRANWEKVNIQVDKDLFELNVFGLVNMATLVLQQFLKTGNGGQFAITSSAAGKLGVPGSRSYTASKHALHGYFEALRIEHERHNIHVTMLCPGPVATDFLKVAFTEQPGKIFGDHVCNTNKRMSAERCGHLSAVAIANKLDEAWISIQPCLAYYYFAQYMPSVSRKFLARMGSGMMMKMRDSQNTIK